MTYDEAKNLVVFENYCNCGGFNYKQNGRPGDRPHMNWCPQREEYNEWYDLYGHTLNKKE